MKTKHLSKNSWVSLSFTLLMLALVFGVNGIPSYDVLEEKTGTLEWFEEIGKRKNTLRFKLNEHDQMFVYHSVGGSLSIVKEALNKDGAALTIAYDPNDSDSAIWEFEDFHPVYQVISNGRLVKSYRSVAAKYNSNSDLAVWLLIAGLLSSVICFGIDWNVLRDGN
ncbi:hypothetical protein KJ365_02705 [Glaciecola sp. XM2]|jgi:hypothetical protein|uniref:hypothetical protein n=1 Tax=Glaciecola sp. XM2 TaxID=1914931 RepID=UPI001BDF09FA|nr:hypothetical protein [Glaciecola sp. XM2]MBT1449776.1 hypothetical protein [Glaciecola sp. XM2]